jgi:hypothetical protein
MDDKKMFKKIKRIKISKAQLKDIFIRTAKTALAAAATAFVGALAVIVFTDLDAFKVALYNAAMAAGTAAGTSILNVGLCLFKNLINDWTLTSEEIDEAFGGAE